MRALLTGMAFVLFVALAGGAEGAPAAHRVYSHLLEPCEHPDYARRYVKPPSWETFGNRTQFAALRGFPMEDGKIVQITETIDQYTKTYQLGNVVWPSYSIVFAENLDELAAEVKRRGLFLFDIWGYVPGSGPGGYWQQFEVPPDVFPLLESTLGDHWLGMDNGEQDGRYIGGYAGQMLPISDNRFEQYLNFQRHFERMGDELGNRLSTLVSLNFGHYFLKEGVYATIGAETAQALPNGQVYYSFIRGAGKQYGVPWFGNASVWNRWGWKTYAGEGPTNGPTKGTSLNLLKRLMLNHLFYNCVFAGFENSWFDGEQKLSPIGHIQEDTQQWLLDHGQPGVMMTPVALMTDFFSGWSFPRHLYTGNVYRVWGNLPYGDGDYLTDALLDMFYPGYQDASYFHDESGFVTPTPYGDAVDCLLSDAPLWLLERYAVLVLAGEIAPTAELIDKLSAFVEKGGCLVTTGANLARFPEGLAGLRMRNDAPPLASEEQVRLENKLYDAAAESFLLAAPAGARVLASAEGVPVAVEAPAGEGRVLVFASPFGLEPNPEMAPPIENPVDAPLQKPMRLRAHVRAILDRLFREQMLFDAGPDLSLIVCRKAPGEYTLCVCNNGLTERPLHIDSKCGPIETFCELPLSQSEKPAPGYLPDGFEGTNVGQSTEDAIAGGDVRIFFVTVKEEGLQEIPHQAPPANPSKQILPLREQRMLKEQLLARPTFFEHFSGAAVDWRYLLDRDIEALRREVGWLERQGVRRWVDFTSGINLYPDLRLVENSPKPYEESLAAIRGVFAKMQAWGAHDAILSLHRVPENNITREDTWLSFENSLRTLSTEAAALDIRLYLRDSTKDGMGLEDRLQLIERVGAANLELAESTALLLDRKVAPDKARDLLEGHVGLWLLGAPGYDVAGRLWNTNAPIAGKELDDSLASLIAVAPEAPILLDCVYATQDQEYLDARVLARIRAHGEETR